MPFSFIHHQTSLRDHHQLLGWFGRSKVTDEDGLPLVQYRRCLGDTTAAPLDEFSAAHVQNHILRMTPEGDDPDEVAARASHPDYRHVAERLRSVHQTTAGEYDVLDLYPLGSALMPCFLRVVRPLRMKDDPSFNMRGLRYVCARHVGILRAAGYSDRAITDASLHYSASRERELVSDLLVRSGHDGVAYENHVDGTGELMWIVADSYQVWPLFGGAPSRVRL